jgi:hypothetical protein
MPLQILCIAAHPVLFSKGRNQSERVSASAAGIDDYSPDFSSPECYHHGFGGIQFWTDF